ncbi:MAG TPA: hypothetical protein VFZ53_17985 [Polyangiaceae bacterium]
MLQGYDGVMPDEFPTLEAVAALATLVALVRAAQVFAALGELRRLSGALASALRAGDRDAAHRLVADSEGRPFSAAASALLDALNRGPVDPQALARTVEHAAIRVQRSSRRASLSGALVGLLLVGLLFYAFVARLSAKTAAAPSTLFDVLVVLGVLVLAVGIVLNQILARETRRTARTLVDAATSRPERA